MTWWDWNKIKCLNTSHGCEVHAGPHETCTHASALVLVYMSVYAKGSSFFLLFIYLLSFIFPLLLLFCFLSIFGLAISGEVLIAVAAVLADTDMGIRTHRWGWESSRGEGTPLLPQAQEITEDLQLPSPLRNPEEIKNCNQLLFEQISGKLPIYFQFQMIWGKYWWVFHKTNASVC